MRGKVKSAIVLYRISFGKGVRRTAYSELIKNFEKIRGYMRDFYVYGFRTRGEIRSKSARSYDNERRRIESWLGDYMGFRQDANGKTVFLTVDSRSVPHNPLYKAFKAKSFTDNDITLHFYILDLLADGEALTVRQITERISAEYLSQFDACTEPDEGTVRKKLMEYEQLGLLESTKAGKELIFRRTQDGVDLPAWRQAIDFFSEADPLGVIGSYLLDKYDSESEEFSYKHRYLLHALDSEILFELLEAIRERRRTELTVFASGKKELREHNVLPVKIYVSTQTGRQYLLAYLFPRKRFKFFRMDNIRRVKTGELEEQAEEIGALYEKLKVNLWGVSLKEELTPDHIEMTVHVGKGEEYILDRLEREKRCGHIEVIDDETYKFVADVCDAAETVPWLRTFIGRVVKLECSNKAAKNRFYEDLEAMRKLYGGEKHAVQ